MKTTLLTVFTFLYICLCGHTCYSANLPVSHSEWPTVSDVQLEQKGNYSLLQWKANKEPKEIYYEIEYSADAVTFKTAAVVLGGFAANEQFTYAYRAKHTAGTKAYYRIKQMNNDGTYRIVSEQSF